MQVELTRAALQDKPILRHLVELYLYDLSEVEGSDVWEVRQLVENVGAQVFWRKVIDRYTNGRFEEVFLQDDRWRGPVQVFETSGESLVDGMPGKPDILMAKRVAPK